MDLTQRKLNKSEWTSIEVPCSQNEIEVLNLIIKGYSDVNIRINNNNSIFTHLKIEYNENMEDYLYNKYLRNRADIIQSQIRIYDAKFKDMKIASNAKINSADKIRIERTSVEILQNVNAYEYILLDNIEKILNYKKQENTKLFTHYYYTLFKLIKNNVSRINIHIVYLCNIVLSTFKDIIDMSIIIENAVEIIEKNEKLLKYADMILYEHQKEIFTVCKNKKSKLILYMAPTGTGKTLTPIALSQQYKIIFVCAARHVGLALAKAAISVNKKIAFAFGCESASDIRLHYFSAKEFTKNKRSGGIGKVDNSVGDEVEIMICDIKSYLPAMYYMLAFNIRENIITYWDEPTITLDYETHPFHSIINNNWKENLIPNMVLSSATLPKFHELTDTISDFKNKFPESETYNIISHDCKKSIPIINKDGYVVLPHYLNGNYDEILNIAKHCENYLTLLRYFDLGEVVAFISYINKNHYSNHKMQVKRYFESIDDINMTNIKVYYITLLQKILPEAWRDIYTYFIQNRQPRITTNDSVDTKGNKISKIKSIGPGISCSTRENGMPLTRMTSEQIVASNVNVHNTPSIIGTSAGYVTTKDSYTLKDGPTIFISNDIEKIAKFCVQQANIPNFVMEDIMNKIEYNNVLNEKINILEKELEFQKEKIEKMNNTSTNSTSSKSKPKQDSKKINKMVVDDESTLQKGEISKLTNELNSIRSMIKSAILNDTFIPNKNHHIKKWAETMNTTNSFTSNIDEHTINDIMLLHGVDDIWKVLLMMGIGVFINHENIKYTEIMKNLADDQKLYMIIASSDYIYGTNYQFCHGYLSKDLDLTQEKIIQAMGRIGRNNIQQTYTMRFRDDAQIFKLFTSDTDKPEIKNMNLLFNSN